MRVRPRSQPPPSDLFKICNVDDGAELGSLTLSDQVRAIKLSPDGHLLAVGTGDGLVKLWASDSRQTKTLRHGELPIPSIAFSTDRQWLATGDSAGVINAFDAKTFARP